MADVNTGADTGLYTVDPGNYQATKEFGAPREYFGIAFGPKTLATSFCSAKSSSLGCAPRLSGDGFASPAASLGFTITASDLNNNRVGMMLYTTNGRASIPFQGALLCVQLPVQRSPAGTTGGNALPTLDCSGTWSIDYNSMIRAKYPNTASDPSVLPPLLTPGTIVQCQWWGRDPGFSAPNNSMLSDGLEFVLSP